MLGPERARVFSQLGKRHQTHCELRAVSSIPTQVFAAFLLSHLKGSSVAVKEERPVWIKYPNTLDFQGTVTPSEKGHRAPAGRRQEAWLGRASSRSSLVRAVCRVTPDSQLSAFLLRVSGFRVFQNSASTPCTASPYYFAYIHSIIFNKYFRGFHCWS